MKTFVARLNTFRQVRDNPGEDWAKEFRQGDDVSALITEVDLEKQRISFSMRKSKIHDASEALHAEREAAMLEDGEDDDLDIILDAERAAQDSDSESDSESAADLEEDEAEDAEMETVSLLDIVERRTSSVNVLGRPRKTPRQHSTWAHHSTGKGLRQKTHKIQMMRMMKTHPLTQ